MPLLNLLNLFKHNNRGSKNMSAFTDINLQSNLSIPKEQNALKTEPWGISACKSSYYQVRHAAQSKYFRICIKLLPC